MEENRRPRRNGPSRRGYKDIATQTGDQCPVPIQEICGLCRNRVLSVSSPNDISVKDDLPDDICQCFFSVNIPGEANFESAPEEPCIEVEQNIEQPNVQICDSRNSNLDPVKEESVTEESNNVSKNDASSSEESKLLGNIFSSNGYTSSPSDQLSDPLLSYRKRTPVSSDKSYKNSPNSEKSPSSSGCTLSLHEQSFDKNISDQKNIASPISGRDSKNSSSTENCSSSGYPLSLGERSPDENFGVRRKSTSPSSGEDSKNFNKENDEANIQSVNENNLEKLNIGECKFNENFSNDQGKQNDDRTRKSEYDNQSELNVNRNGNLQYEQRIPTEMAKYIFVNSRPLLPPPFVAPYPHIALPYHADRNPAINMPTPRPLSLPQPHTQAIRSYGNPAMNMPINRTDIPGTFPVLRPQMSTSFHRNPPNDENSSLSKKLLLDFTKEDQGKKSIKEDKRIEDWLEALPNVPPHSKDSASAYEYVWSEAENEEKEAIPPCLSDPFTDERSSTEISEEENLRQRSLRCPPVKHKKNKPK